MQQLKKYEMCPIVIDISDSCIFSIQLLMFSSIELLVEKSEIFPSHSIKMKIKYAKKSERIVVNKCWINEWGQMIKSIPSFFGGMHLTGFESEMWKAIDLILSNFKSIHSFIRINKNSQFAAKTFDCSKKVSSLNAN